MIRRPWLPCLSLPTEVYALCRRSIVPNVSRSFGSSCHYHNHQHLGKTATLEDSAREPSSRSTIRLQLAHKAIPHLVRRSASSAKNPVTFFDSNLKRQDSWSAKSQTDIEKSWLKAHLKSLPEHDKETDDAASEEQESPDQSLHEERKARAVQANARLTLDDEPPRYTTDSHSLSYRDLIIRCTTFDAEGNIQKHSEPVAKNALCAQHNLQPRDLRKIDSRIPNVIPTM